MYGAHVYRLNVHITERVSAEDAANGRNSSRVYHNYWIASRDGFVGKNEWIRAVLPLPLITNRYIARKQNLSVDEYIRSHLCFKTWFSSRFKKIDNSLCITRCRISVDSSSVRFCFVADVSSLLNLVKLLFSFTSKCNHKYS
jgi:hypothetical protein